MRKVTVSAKTVELAVLEALQQLKVTRDRSRVVVKSAPRAGFLGFGAKNAEVEVSVVENPIGDVERFLREVFVAMGLSVRLRWERMNDEVVFHLAGDRVGLLIGKHGQTLDALQYLVNAVGNKFSDKSTHFIVDAEGYREKRRQALTYTANRMAEKAIATGREITLEPMTAQERKMIHVALQGRTNVRTESRGTEPSRSIVIVPVGQRERGRKQAPEAADGAK